MKLPESEYKERIKKIRYLMVQRKLDALLIYSPSAENAGYVSGYFRGSRFQEVIIPMEGNLSLIVVPGMLNSSVMEAKNESWIEDVKGVPYRQWGVDYVKHTKETLEERGLLEAKIGVSGIELMSKTLYEHFIEKLPKVKFEDSRGLVEKVRFIKSSREIELIKEACRLTDLGIEALMEGAKTGRSVAETVAEAEYIAKRAGAEETSCPLSAGMPWIWGNPPPDRVFKVGDMFATEFNARYRGYQGQVARTCVIGKATEEQMKIYETVQEASEKMTEIVKPGVTGEELWQIGFDVIDKAGYKWSGIRYGHGMGLTGAEGIDLAPGDKNELKTGCYLMVHPHLFIPETANGAMIGDPLLVTETGYDRLCTYKKVFEYE